MQKNTTYHFSVERYERVSYIIDCIGLGDKVVLEAPSRKDPTKVIQITNTGVTLIKTIKDDTFITAWITSIDQLYCIAKECNYAIPNYLYKCVKANQRYKKHQP